MKVRAVIKRLEADGWYLDRTKGSHRQFKHPDKSGVVTVPGKLSDDLAPGTLRRFTGINIPLPLVSTSLRDATRTLNQLQSRELSEVETRQHRYFLSRKSPK
ncbi:YcfA family protein [Calothrix sp. NIES-2100]|uniref:type II toxin-antitoxin system HicA family toxin n=1 Tax=Calothrix sp. NIES-2100 TaxID=1954172 RepID=UPI000B614A6A|nr:YcfA family protein [Calothrix sp. NIES-2100]